MERFTQSIKKSIETENWYSALTLALTIPDICGRLTYPDLHNKSQKRYEKWLNNYVLHLYQYTRPGEEVFTYMSGGDCYALRCALLHEGRNDITSQKARREAVSKFVFSVTNTSHRCMLGNVLLLNLQAFCSEICEGVESWNEEYKNNPAVQAAIKELLTINTGMFSATPGIGVA